MAVEGNSEHYQQVRQWYLMLKIVVLFVCVEDRSQYNNVDLSWSIDSRVPRGSWMGPVIGIIFWV